MSSDEPSATANGQALVAALWRAVDPDSRVSRGDVSIWIDESVRQNAEIPAALADELAVFDEYLSWMVQLSTLMLFDSGEVARDRIVLGSLAGGVASLLFSVRQLVLSGFDVSAKILMRSVTEYADVLFLLIVHPDQIEDYAGVESFQAANKFWHRAIKGWKARRQAFETLGTGNTRSDWFRELEAYQKQEEELMALSTHGAYIATFRATFPEMEPTERKKRPLRWAGYLGQVTPASVRTLEYVAYALLPIYACEAFPFGVRDRLPAVVAASNSKLAASLQARREVLVELLLRRSTPHDVEPTNAAGAGG